MQRFLKESSARLNWPSPDDSAGVGVGRVSRHGASQHESWAGFTRRLLIKAQALQTFQPCLSRTKKGGFGENPTSFLGAKPKKAGWPAGPVRALAPSRGCLLVKAAQVLVAPSLVQHEGKKLSSPPEVSGLDR